MATSVAKTRKRLTPEQKQDIIANKGKVSGTEMAKKHSVTKKTIYTIWGQVAAGEKVDVPKAVAAPKPEKVSAPKPKAKSGKRTRLTDEQRQDILTSKGTMTGSALAKKHGVALNTVYKIWNTAAAKATAKPAAKAAAKPVVKTGAKRGRPAGSVAVKSVGSNQPRIEFCKKWIGILEAELKRLQNETDYLAAAEAILTKVIAN